MQRLAKRLIDCFVALATALFSIPFFIVIPILIKLTSRGPVFFRHERLGRGGRPIRVWKFRTMYADADARLRKILESDPAAKAEWEADFKLRKDPRITPVGRFLRKTSLDELPQLINVFAGEMAVVGPRPIVRGEVAKYGDSYKFVFAAKPGITGLWQVSGRNDVDYATRIALDRHYVMNWNVWIDLWVLQKTFFSVLSMNGAR